MRVLLVTGSYPPMPCGVGDYAAQLATALGRRHDLEVAVLTSLAAAEPGANAGHRVLNVARSWDLSETGRAWEAIRSWDPDIVHVQIPTQGYEGGLLPSLLPLLLRLSGRRVVQTWHEYVVPRNLRDLPNAIALHGLIVVRPDFAARLPSVYRRLIGNKPIEFIPNASTIPPQVLAEAERASVRARYAHADRRMIAFFGFAFDHKRVERVFSIADPARDHLVLICRLDPADPYHRRILEVAEGTRWSGRVTVTGFLPAAEAGRVLAAADAVVLPYETGGGGWNTSLKAAVMQGTFVLTTSERERGYDPACNIHYSAPDDLAGMRNALAEFAGRRSANGTAHYARAWEEIAQAHVDFYERFVTGGRADRRVREEVR